MEIKFNQAVLLEAGAPFAHGQTERIATPVARI